MAELSLEEAAALGPLLRALSRALQDGFGAQKAYVLFLAEQAGFAHLHVHVVPRLPDLPPERRGGGIFAYLQEPEAAWLPPAEMDRIAEQLRPSVLAYLGRP
jgi:diadenosine tetraphosphate (Ap4A) HIT family hydrolase